MRQSNGFRCMVSTVAELIDTLSALRFSWSLVWLIHLGLAPFAMAHVLLTKRLPQASFGWLLVIAGVPLLGIIVYGIFGVNRIHRRAQRFNRGHARQHNALTEQDDEALVQALPQAWQSMARAGKKLSGLPLTGGNTVEHFHTGEQLFPVMMEALRNARQSIYIASYTFDLGGIGEEFVGLLVAAKERGVDVRVLVDCIGDRVISQSSVITALQQQGVPALHFLPPTLWPPIVHLNLRNHRKILIVDKTQGFAGGINITQKNCRSADHQPSNDDHFRFTGPVVNQLLAVFAEDWAFTAQTKNDITLMQAPRQDGRTACRVIPDGPDHADDQILLLMTAAASQARTALTLFSPYFLPTEPLIGALRVAALRGVRVRVLIPGRSNYGVVDWACRHYLPDLVQAGLEIYAIGEPFLHSKLFLVDEYYAMVGSTNIDPRSLHLNFELMVEIYDADVVKRLQQHADAQFAKAERITLEQLRAQPLALRLRNAVAGLAQPYL